MEDEAVFHAKIKLMTAASVHDLQIELIDRKARFQRTASGQRIG
jgi:hypothetical protein